MKEVNLYKHETFREEIVLGTLEDFRALMHEIFDSQSQMREDSLFLQGERTPSDYPKNMGRWETTLGATLQKRGYVIARQLPNGTTKLQFAYYSKYQPIGSIFEIDFVNQVKSHALGTTLGTDEQTQGQVKPENKSRMIIRDNLNSMFNLGELNNLCFDLEVNFENLPGTTLKEKALELVDYCYRHGLANNLITRCQELRPQGSWPYSISQDERSDSIAKIITDFETNYSHENESKKKSAKKIKLELSKDELFFLYWAMKFIDGGPISQEDEKQRSWMEYEFKKLLIEYFDHDFQE